MTFGEGEPRGEALRRLRAALAAAGIPDPSLEARVLVRLATGLEATALTAYPEAPIGPEAAAQLGRYVCRRLAREPIARIAGRREFWGLTFRLSPGTLEPRPDTETVVETALAALPGRPATLRILDLGTGSGCLLVALLAERPAAWGLGIDLSADAVVTARANAAANGVGARAAFAVGRWAEAVEGRFDLVVSNPPYIPTGDLAALAPEVARHDPPAALDGGRDGLEAYRSILAGLAALLGPDGVAVLEIGYDQAAAVAALARDCRFAVRRVARDLGGRDRALLISRST